MEVLADSALEPLRLTRMVTYLETAAPVCINLKNARDMQVLIGDAFKRAALDFQSKTCQQAVIDDDIKNFINKNMSTIYVDGMPKYESEKLKFCQYTETFGAQSRVQTLEIVYGDFETKREFVTRAYKGKFNDYKRDSLSNLLLAIMMMIGKQLCVDQNLTSKRFYTIQQLEVIEALRENSALNRIAPF